MAMPSVGTSLAGTRTESKSAVLANRVILAMGWSAADPRSRAVPKGWTAPVRSSTQ
jgi:hypothetical protein